jgi:hypothetical protein
VFDALASAKEPRRCTAVQQAPPLLEARLSPAGGDLKPAFVVAMIDHIDARPLLGEFSSTAAGAGRNSYSGNSSLGVGGQLGIHNQNNYTYESRPKEDLSVWLYRPDWHWMQLF